MKKYLLILSVIFFINQGYSQLYETAIGLRGGTITGITFKQFLSEPFAVEAIGNVGANYFGLTALYLHHKPIIGDQWTWHYGIGGHLNAVNGIGIDLGVSAALGLDYTLPDYPLTFSINTIPSWTIMGVRNLNFIDGHLAIRYIIK